MSASCSSAETAGAKTSTATASQEIGSLPSRTSGMFNSSRSIPAFAITWPLRANPSSRYGPRNGRKHEGVDLPAPKGTAIRAAAGGRVVYSGHGMRGYGKVIVLKHGDDMSTVYAHNSANLVRKGQTVRQGEVIGRVGKSGRATGYHLHFEVRIRGVAQDPLTYLPKA